MAALGHRRLARRAASETPQRGSPPPWSRSPGRTRSPHRDPQRAVPRRLSRRGCRRRRRPRQGPRPLHRPRRDRRQALQVAALAHDACATGAPEDWKIPAELADWIRSLSRERTLGPSAASPPTPGPTRCLIQWSRLSGTGRRRVSGRGRRDGGQPMEWPPRGGRRRRAVSPRRRTGRRAGLRPASPPGTACRAR